MTDERLTELLDDAARTYRVPPEPDLDAMWWRIQHEAFDRRRSAWRRVLPDLRHGGLYAAGIAAAMLLGVAVGRYSAHRGVATAPPSVAAADAATGTDSTAQDVSSGYAPAATELLGKTAVLLSALPNEARRGGTDVRFTSQASELLSTTRLLLDSPAASDRRFKELLEDLELVLAQISRLDTGRGHEEIDFITDALVERDVMPRIRSAVARLSAGDD